LLGAFLALLSAITFAFTNAGIRRGVLTGTVGQAMAISMPIGLVMFLATTWVIGYLPQIAVFSLEALLWLCAAGAIHFVWGRYCNMRATKAMGANLVGPVQELNLVVSLVLAISLLGETITPLRAFGIACVFLGPALSLKLRREPANAAAPNAPTYGESEAPTHLRPAFRPNYLEGYVFAFLSALGFGTSPIFISMAIDSAGIGISLAAGLVSYCAATLLLVPFLINPSTIRSIQSIKPGPARWFVVSAIFITLSQMFRYMALSVAPVIVVAPIMRLSLIFRLVFSRLINRDQEVFSGGVFLGTAISLIGALSLSVSTEFVLAYVRLPDYLVRLAEWHWP
jgi:drug/metabolite transporter (DMT)-like permease